MTHTRHPDLQTFIDRAEAAVSASTRGSDVAKQAAALVFDRLRQRQGRAFAEGAARLPVCDHLPAALQAIHPARGAVAEAFAALLPGLSWHRRRSARPEDAAFWNGHANAMVFGPGGLEVREDVMVGATVIAPGTTYPDHTHPPEETYLPLTVGQWWNSATDWTDPGADGLFHNTPGITHSMRALPGKPFLALWFLPV